MAHQHVYESSFEDSFFISQETYVHPTAIVGDRVVLGQNVKIGPYCVILGNVSIGSGTRIHAHTVIGQPAQVTGMHASLGSVSIGENCELREFVSIHASRYPDGTTKIGNHCYIMNYAHISHDATLEDNVTLINSVNLAGHTYLEKSVIVMANAATHQFCRIGTLSALAPYSAIRQDLPPFGIYSGLPASFTKLNLIGIRRAGINISSCDALRHVTRLFYQEKLPLENIIATATSNDWGSNEYVQKFISFIQHSKRGISRRMFSQNDPINYPENKEEELIHD